MPPGTSAIGIFLRGLPGPVQRRRLGPRGPEVSALGLGCMGINQSYGEPDPKGGEATVRRALELGIDFFDTADVYGPYTNEEVVGRALRESGSRFFLATKCGIVRGEGGSLSGRDGSPAHIRESCEASLRRLGVERIDLYYLHRVDPKVPIEVSVGAMAELVDDGKVRYLGLSEVDAGTLRRACAVHPITAVQSEYSLWTREPEEGILPACRELGVGFVPFSPLGRGFLTGRLSGTEDLPASDFRRSIPRFQPGPLQRNLRLVDRLGALARELSLTPAQLALAWLLAQGPDLVPIPGTKRPEYLEENAAAAEVRLSRRDLERIEEAVPKGAVEGARYSSPNRPQPAGR